MGMWDITCALSYLPIRGEDPIRWIFLREALFTDGKPWAHWIPVSLPLKGVYDSYGGIGEVEEDNVVRWQVDCFKRWAEWDEGRTDGHKDDVAEGFPNTITSLVYGCERGALKLRLPYDEREREGKEPLFKRVNTAAFVVHEEIYQLMIAPVDASPPGVGSWRSRMESIPGSKPDRTRLLRKAVDWLREDGPRKATLTRILRETGDTDLLEGLLARGTALSLSSDLGSHPGAATPDMAVLGNEWDPSPRNWPTVFEFTEGDWDELGRRMFELDALHYTMSEIRRQFHPALHTDQYYYPHNQLDGSRLFAHYVDRMTREFQEREAAEHAEDAE